MTRTERYVSLGSVVVPFAAFLLAIVLLWQRAVDAIAREIAELKTRTSAGSF